jgi:signal transduction histidine kinase
MLLTGTGLGLLLISGLGLALDEGVSSIEQQNLDAGSARLRAVISDEGKALQSIAAGIAHREALSRFLRDRALSDVDTSLTPALLEDSEIELAAVLSEAGDRLVARKRMNKELTLLDTDLDPSSGALAVQKSGLWLEETEQEDCSGCGQWWVLGSAKIPPLGLGDPTGSLVLGRRLTEQLMARWQNQSGLSLELQSPEPDPSTIWGDLSLPGLLPDRPFQLRYSMPRHFSSWADNIYHYMLASVVLIGLGMLGSALVALDIRLFRPAQAAGARLKAELTGSTVLSPEAAKSLEDGDFIKLSSTLGHALLGAQQASEELLALQQKTWALLDSFPAAIAFKDRYLRYTSVNRRFADLVGRAPHAVEGRRDEELFPEATAARFKETDEALLRYGIAHEYREFFLDGNEQSGYSTTSHTLHKIPLKDNQGKLSGILCLLLNNQERSLAEAKALARTRLLLESTEELRDPVDALLGSAQLLKSQTEDPTTLELLHILEVGSGMLLGTLQDLHSFAQVESGQPLQLEPGVLFALSTTWQEAVAAWKPLATNRGISLEQQESQLPLGVFGKQALVRRVMENLLASVIQYSPEEKPVLLSIKLESTGEDALQTLWVRLELSASGKPISREQADGFFRVEGLCSRLGLLMAHHFIRILGGQLKILPGEGLFLLARLPFSLEPVAEELTEFSELLDEVTDECADEVVAAVVEEVASVVARPVDTTPTMGPRRPKNAVVHEHEHR